MVPLGRGEAAATAVAGSRGGKKRSWTRLGPGLPGGRGPRLLPEAGPSRDPSAHLRDPTPSRFPWGWVSSPPFLFPWRPDPAPLGPTGSPPACLGIFPCSPGLGAIPDRFPFPAFSQGCSVRTPLWLPSKLWVLFVPDSWSRFAAKGAGAVHWVPGYSYLFSQMKRNVHPWGCVSQSKGSGRFLPD